MTIVEHTDKFVFHLDYRPKILSYIKQLPERKFDYLTKTWSVPIHHRDKVEMFAKRFKFTFEQPSVMPDGPKITDYTIAPMPELTASIPLKMTLRPYQESGVAYNIEHMRSIIGDEPGLGKTAQAIATIVATAATPCLVICPSSLKINWLREFEKWSDLKCLILNDNVKNTFINYYRAGIAQVFIVNFESLKKYFVSSIEIPKGEKFALKYVNFKDSINVFQSVIIDESHRVKDPSTQQTKFTKGIAKGKRVILALTGTPVVNKPKDLIAQLGIIERLSDFGGLKFFKDRYCNGDKPPFHSNLKELNYQLYKHCFYRRLKSEVLKDLPAKSRDVMICGITNRAEYDHAHNDLVSFLKTSGCSDAEILKKMRGEIMVRIGVLKQLSAKGKVKEVIEHIQEIVDAGEKIIVFCHLKDVANQLMAAFPGSVSVRGGDDNITRQANVDKFQTDPKTQVIVCSIKAAGVGITLTASSRVAFIEFPWTYADCVQCEDRAHRMGQLNSVQVTYFLGDSTIDKWCYEVIQKKKEISNSITGDVEEVEENVIDKLITLFNQKVA